MSGGGAYLELCEMAKRHHLHLALFTGDPLRVTAKGTGKTTVQVRALDRLALLEPDGSQRASEPIRHGNIEAAAQRLLLALTPG